MTDEKVSPPASLEPVKVTVIGTGDGTSLETGTVALTPKGQSNLIAIVVKPAVALAVRFVHAYGAALVGLLVGIPLADKATGMVPFSDFWDLLVKSSTLALSGPTIELLKNIVTIFARLENKYPLWTGSV